MHWQSYLLPSKSLSQEESLTKASNSVLALDLFEDRVICDLQENTVVLPFQSTATIANKLCFQLVKLLLLLQSGVI